jgi:transposase-like protein
MRVKRERARAYSFEFKEECVALVGRDARSYQQLGADLGVNPETLRGWYNAAMARKNKGARKASPPPPLKEESPEAKLARLERENARLLRENEALKMDKEILKKAAAFFARENE